MLPLPNPILKSFECGDDGVIEYQEPTAIKRTVKH